MAQTITFQRGQSTCAATLTSSVAGYANGNAGGTVTLITAPTGTTRIILNQLTVCQSSPVSIDSSGNTNTPNQALNVAVYLNNNYNGNGSTRNASTVGYTATDGGTARIAFPAGNYNSNKTGFSTNTGISGPLYRSQAGVATGTFPFFTPASYGSAPTQDGLVGTSDVFCLSPSNIYMCTNDTLTLKVQTSLTNNTSQLPTYTVTWSFTLITET
jgi:hypothetical protein